ncbi:MAG: single-stranded DNA-binding protein [Christensenellales bacterium]
MNFTYDNHAQLLGTIVQDPVYDHTLYGEDFYTFALHVKRLSQTADVLPVTVSGHGLHLACSGQIVRVTGQVRSYNKLIDGASRLIVTVFAKRLEFLSAQTPCHNEILLSGYVCKPPTYRKTPFEREITDLLLAVNRAYHKSDYLPCIAWGKTARFASHLKVGAHIRIKGRMQSRAYEKTYPTGETALKTAYEISIAQLEVLPE